MSGESLKKRKRGYSEQDIAEIVELYQEYRFSLILIGSIFGVSNVPIRSILKEVGKFDRPSRYGTQYVHVKLCRTCNTSKAFALFDFVEGKNSLKKSCRDCLANGRNVRPKRETIPPDVASDILNDCKISGTSLNTLRSKFGFHSQTISKLLAKNNVVLEEYKRPVNEIDEHGLVFCKKCGTTKEPSCFRRQSDRGFERVCKSCQKTPERQAKKRERGHLRKRRMVHAKVDWADHEKILQIYKEAVEKEIETGIKHHVDHIVPIISKLVCGLHVEHNLRAIPAIDNLVKGNLWWDDMPDNPKETIKELYKGK